MVFDVSFYVRVLQTFGRFSARLCISIYTKLSLTNQTLYVCCSCVRLIVENLLNTTVCVDSVYEYMLSN